MGSTRCTADLRCCLGLLGFLVARPAAATPFTLPAHRLALDLSFGYDQARSQWTVGGDHGVFPLGGEFSSESLQLGVRYGILDGLEAQVRGAYKVATYTALPLHLFPAPAGAGQPGALTGQVFDFSGQEGGVGDLYLGLSYRPLQRAVNLALETELKVPTGYRAPSGTLCQDLPPDKVAAAVGQMSRDPAAGLLRPRDFCTGATLGDGQVDWLFLLELGKYIPLTRTFFRAETGMNFRFQGPGQQYLAAAKVGENIRDLLIFFAGARLAYTVNRGEGVGTTVNSSNPDAAPEDYPGLLLRFDAASRDHSFLFVEAGLILRLPQNVEVRGSYARALWGRNFPELNSVNLGVAVAAL